MATTPKTHIPQPEWLDRPPDEWPADVRALFCLLGSIAERHLAWEKAQQCKLSRDSA